MLDAETAWVVDNFWDRTLPKTEWTHHAHLRVCWATLSTHAPADAIDLLRGGIRAYNVATGTKNTLDSGYHETLTVFYVGAVRHIDAVNIDQLIAAPLVSTNAPRSFWSPDVLFSRMARAQWVEPDLAPLPWRPDTQIH